MPDTVTVSLPSPRGPKDVTVSYARVGTGEPLLLLHGIGHHRQAWDPVIPILAAERDVIAVDLPGFGASPALPEGMTHDLPTVVPLLGALCEALEIERPHVAGNSLGGLLALELGREKLVRSVTALSPMRLLVTGGTALRLRPADRHAAGCPPHARPGHRATLPLGGRADGADQLHLRPARPPFT